MEACALTHVDAEGVPRMVDVGDKPVTGRRAVAACRVLLAPRTAQLLAERALPKGDAVTVARIAGIQAAKRTSELIPLCHQVALAAVDVEIGVDVATGVVEVTASAEASDRTGVEMEALVATTVAALTVYDMVKAVQRDATVTDVRVVHKSGGTRGR